MKPDTNTQWFFLSWDPKIKEGKCPYHGDQDIRSSKTTRIPTHPIVIKALPEDTEYDNRYYRDFDLAIDPNPANPHFINMGIVTSSVDKRSIHRAELCLKMQGNEIVSRKTVWLDIPQSKVKKIDLTVIRTKQLVKNKEERGVAMYCYAGNKRITASNFKRIAYMAWDRMILGQNYRWSYILLNCKVYRSYKDTEKAMFQFIEEFFPLVEK